MICTWERVRDRGYIQIFQQHRALPGTYSVLGPLRPVWHLWNMTEWAGIGLQELLDTDLRPSFVVDLVGTPLEHPQICHRNAHFTNDYDFDETQVLGKPQDCAAFQSWAFHPTSQSLHSSFHYCGLTWVANTLRGRYRLIQATSLTPCLPQSENSTEFPAALSPGAGASQFDRLKGYHDKHPNHDWTRLETPTMLSEHIQLLRTWDWGKTSLGPMSAWSPLLRFMANLILVDPNPVSYSSRS
jgi:hypothetical protein